MNPDYIQLPLDFEVWKPIPGYEGLYEVSDQGRVKRLANTRGKSLERIRKLTVNRFGYRCVGLTINGRQRIYFVHKLVMQAFVGPCPRGKNINHKNGIKSNNYLSNLEYVTQSENMKHAFALELKQPPSNSVHPGSSNGRAKLTNDDVRMIRKLVESGMTKKAVGERFNVAGPTIGKIIRGVSWKYIK